MNRGFGYYYGQAMKSARATVFSRKNFIKAYAAFFTSLLGVFSVIFSSVFLLADMRQAKIVKDEGRVDVSQSFKVACRGKSLGTMIFTMIVEGFIFLAGIGFILLVAYCMLLLSNVVLTVVYTISPDIMHLIFLAPCALGLVIYCCVMTMLFAPTAYVIDANPDIGVADVLSSCFKTMKTNGKMTWFLNLFVTSLIEGAVLGAGYAGFYAILMFINDYRLLYIICTGWLILVIIAFLLVAPMCELAKNISNRMLFEDIVLDPVTSCKRTSGINIKRCDGMAFDPAANHENLVALFDATSSDEVPLKSGKSAKRENKEVKAAKPAPAVKSEAPRTEKTVEKAAMKTEEATPPVQKPEPVAKEAIAPAATEENTTEENTTEENTPEENAATSPVEDEVAPQPVEEAAEVKTEQPVEEPATEPTAEPAEESTEVSAEEEAEESPANDGEEKED